MAGSYKTISSLVSESDSDIADNGVGAITAAILRQQQEDLIASLAPTETSLTFGASLAWALDTNPIAYVTLTGNVTITASQGQSGHSYRLAVIQDSTGGRTVTLAGVTLLGAAVWQTAAGGVNLLTVDVVNGTRYAGVM